MAAGNKYFFFIREKCDRFGSFLDVGIPVDCLPELAKLADARGWVNLKVRPRREHGNKGQTHSACWSPPYDPQMPQAAPPPSPPPPPPVADVRDVDLPGTEEPSGNIPF
jgi:hypothetical protein